MKKFLLSTLFIFVLNVSLVGAQSNSCFAHKQYYLKYGARDSSTGGEVTKFQNFLIEKGFLKTNSTGYFGLATKAAAIAYQRSVGLPALGNIGNMTRDIMNKNWCGDIKQNSNNTSTNTNNSTDSWKTYTDNNYGYSFKYPSNIFGPFLTKIDKMPYFNFYNNNSESSSFGIQISSAFTSLDDVLKRYSSNDYNKSYVTVGKTQSLAISSPQLGSEIFVPVNGNKMMIITVNGLSDLTLQILSTFTFSNQNTSNVSWKSLQIASSSILLTLKYPSKNGIELKPTLVVVEKSKVDLNGCLPSYSGKGFAGTGTKYTLNGITFCQSVSTDEGMGHLWTSYDNVFVYAGKYYNLNYTISTVNGCSNFMDASGVSNCEANNSTVIDLLNLINQSLSTVVFG